MKKKITLFLMLTFLMSVTALCVFIGSAAPDLIPVESETVYAPNAAKPNLASEWIYSTADAGHNVWNPNSGGAMFSSFPSTQDRVFTYNKPLDFSKDIEFKLELDGAYTAGISDIIAAEFLLSTSTAGINPNMGFASQPNTDNPLRWQKDNKFAFAILYKLVNGVPSLVGHGAGECQHWGNMPDSASVPVTPGQPFLMTVRMVVNGADRDIYLNDVLVLKLHDIVSYNSLDFASNGNKCYLSFTTGTSTTPGTRIMHYIRQQTAIPNHKSFLDISAQNWTHLTNPTPIDASSLANAGSAGFEIYYPARARNGIIYNKKLDPNNKIIVNIKSDLTTISDGINGLIVSLSKDYAMNVNYNNPTDTDITLLLTTSGNGANLVPLARTNGAAVTGGIAGINFSNTPLCVTFEKSSGWVIKVNGVTFMTVPFSKIPANYFDNGGYVLLGSIAGGLPHALTVESVSATLHSTQPQTPGHFVYTTTGSIPATCSTPVYDTGACVACGETVKIASGGFNSANHTPGPPANCLHPQRCTGCLAELNAQTSSGGVHSGGTATCYAQAVCIGCGESYGSTLPHNISSDFTTDVYPDCTNAGSRSKHCTNSGCTHKASVEVLPALGHTGGTATCQVLAVCETCSQPYGVKAAHNFDTEFTTDKTATCIVDGSESRHCLTPGCLEKADTRTIPMSGGAHNTGVWNTITASTCKVKGTEELICSLCSSIITTRELPLSTENHLAGAWYTVTNPTCTQNGTEEFQCTGCRASLNVSRQLDAFGHAGGTPTCYSKPICTRCGQFYGDMLTHNFSPVLTIEKNPTCSVPGKQSHRCLNIGCTITQGEIAIPPTGHTFGTWYTRVAPTHLEPGIEKRVCTICQEFEERPIPIVTGIVIEFTKPTASTTLSEPITLTPNVYNAYDGYKIIWSSSDKKVATVDQNGVVTPVAFGTCKIIAEIEGTGEKASVLLTIKEDKLKGFFEWLTQWLQDIIEKIKSLFGMA